MGMVSLIAACADNDLQKNKESQSDSTILKSKGVGPIKQVELGAIDPKRAALGQRVFQSKCSACHKMEERYVGPAVAGVTLRRTPEWILNMILNPVEMTQKDPIAQELLATYLTQMTYQNVSEDEAKAVLEYFRDYDSKMPASPQVP